MSKHRGIEVRPRYGRMGAAVASLAVTLVAVMGGFGALPVSSGQANASAGTPAAHRASDNSVDLAAATTEMAVKPRKNRKAGVRRSADATETTGGQRHDTSLPPRSGHGKRVVYSESRQRVWLVEDDGSVARTYLVSGSIYDNLDPGAFNVYSRSEDAWGVDDSGSMKYFVRFTQGDTGAAIGFHDIPVKDGVPAQSEAQLGTPQSHGCIRQRRADAIALWEFAPLGTSVIVTA